MCGIAGIEHRFSTDQTGDDAASVDIADQNNRHIGRARKSHIGDVMSAQVHFRGAASALDKYDISLPFDAGVAVQHEVSQIRLHALISTGVCGSSSATLYYELSAHLTLWFQQHGIHVHARRDACSSRLQSLRSANLATVDGHRRVVGHVLRFKRPDLEPAICQRPRHASDNQRFPNIGCRALEHERAGGQGQNSIPG